MAGKGKDKIKLKLKKYEIEFDDKVIDLKRFAYDVMKYTALKFRVPESCIAVWDGKTNDYGHDDFISAVCRRVIHISLADRYRYYEAFKEHYDRNKLAKPEHINKLLQESIDQEMVKYGPDEQIKVGISLSVLCDLFLFLYSEDISLCPRRLATQWFNCYLSIYKKKFENSGGLEELYRVGNIKKFEDVDEFVDQFMEDHCFPYKTSASNPAITELFVNLYRSRIPKPMEGPEDLDEAVKSAAEMVKRENPNLELRKVSVVPFHEASGMNIPPNTDFGIRHDKLLQLSDPSVAPSQDSPKGKPQHRIKSSRKQRFKREMDDDDGVDLLPNPGLGVPLPHEMYDFDFPVDASQSQKLPERRTDLELSTHIKRSPREEKSKKPSSRARIEQGFGQPSSDSSEIKRPIVTRTPPKFLPALSPEGQPQQPGTLPYKQKTKTMQSSLYANMEQGLVQLISDSNKMKQSRRKTPSSPRTLVSSKDPSVTRPEQPQFLKHITDEDLMKLLCVSDDESPVTSEREETLGGDVPSNPGIGVKQGVYDYLLANVDDISKNLTDQIIQASSTPLGKSGPKRRNENPSLGASVEQCPAQPSSDSSRTDASLKDVFATTFEELSRRSRIRDEGIAEILRKCEEVSLMSQRCESPEIELPYNPGRGVTLTREMYDFPLVDVAELSQNLLEEHSQETSKGARRLSHRERWDRKPSLLASVEKGFEQPSSETRIPTITSPKGPAASKPEEQPQHHRTLSCQQKMFESGLRANVEHDLEQASSNFYEMKQSIRKTSSDSRTRVLPQDPSVARTEDQPRHTRNFTDEQIAKILRNLTDEEVERLLSIPEESPLTSKQNRTSEVDLPSNLGLDVPLPRKVHLSPLTDVELSKNLPEDHIHETSTLSNRLSHLERKFSYLEIRLSRFERRDRKLGSSASEELDLEQPRLDFLETKNLIATRSVASPKDSSATNNPKQHRLPGIGGEKMAEVSSVSEEESLTCKKETTGVDLPSNPGFGVPPPQEMDYMYLSC